MSGSYYHCFHQRQVKSVKTIRNDLPKSTSTPSTKWKIACLLSASARNAFLKEQKSDNKFVGWSWVDSATKTLPFEQRHCCFLEDGIMIKMIKLKTFMLIIIIMVMVMWWIRKEISFEWDKRWWTERRGGIYGLVAGRLQWWKEAEVNSVFWSWWSISL